jgi:hypothetical protein
MKNFYFYFFYLLTSFTKKINRRNFDPAFSGIAYLSVLMGFNLFTLLSFLELNNFIILKGKAVFICILLGVFAINYILLYKRSDTIINFYTERRLSVQNKWPLLMFLLYVVISLLLVAYTSYLVRNTSN